jgi:hypothetical protein
MRSIHKLTPARPRPPMRWPKELRRWLLRGGVSLVRGTPVALGTLAQRPPVPPFSTGQGACRELQQAGLPSIRNFSA